MVKFTIWWVIFFYKPQFTQEIIEGDEYWMEPFLWEQEASHGNSHSPQIWGGRSLWQAAQGMDTSHKTHTLQSLWPSLHCLMIIKSNFQRKQGCGWLDQQTNQNGLCLQVIILGFIRPEWNFDSLEALVDAIRCGRAPLKCSPSHLIQVQYF